MKPLRFAFAVMAVLAFALAFGTRVEGQLGRQQGLIDPTSPPRRICLRIASSECDDCQRTH